MDLNWTDHAPFYHKVGSSLINFLQNNLVFIIKFLYIRWEISVPVPIQRHLYNTKSVLKRNSKPPYRKALPRLLSFPNLKHLSAKLPLSSRPCLHLLGPHCYKRTNNYSKRKKVDSKLSHQKKMFPKKEFKF